MTSSAIGKQHIDQVRDYLLSLQDNICDAFRQLDGRAGFIEDTWQREEGGGGRSRVMEGGAVFEFTLPALATEHE